MYLCSMYGWQLPGVGIGTIPVLFFVQDVGGGLRMTIKYPSVKAGRLNARAVSVPCLQPPSQVPLSAGILVY